MSNEIENKKAQIANYERILSEYQSGRWFDQGRRHLAQLKRELDEIMSAASPEDLDGKE